MKKFTKNNLNFITGLIIGGIIFSSITVFASTFLARDVTYKPTDTTFDVNNVGSALDKLYEIDKLRNDINTNQASYGIFYPSASTVQTIDVGFKPTKVFLFTPPNSVKAEVAYMYDESYSKNVIMVGYQYNNSTYFNERALSQFSFSTVDNGFTWKQNSSTYEGMTYWYAFK